jgi:hypothetical protein
VISERAANENAGYTMPMQYSGGYATAECDKVVKQRKSHFYVLRLIENSPSRKLA